MLLAYDAMHRLTRLLVSRPSVQAVAERTSLIACHHQPLRRLAKPHNLLRPFTSMSSRNFAKDDEKEEHHANELKKVKPRRPNVPVADKPRKETKEAEVVIDVVDLEQKRCSALCTAEGFDLVKLRWSLDPSFFLAKELMSDQALYSPIPDGGHVFFFRDGTFVCWAATDAQIERCLFDSQKAQFNTYSIDLQETEEMNFVESKKWDSGMNGEIIIISLDENKTVRHRLALSNALAASAKLAVLEKKLDQYLSRNRNIPQILQEGEKLPLSRKEVLRQIGELLNFRGKLNLHSELLETPDYYWSEPELEELYRRMSRTLDVPHRISILNKKLDYANEFVEVLRNHLSENHSLKLEWMIIALIAVEVAFEFIHYADKMGVFPWFS